MFKDSEWHFTFMKKSTDYNTQMKLNTCQSCKPVIWKRNHCSPSRKGISTAFFCPFLLSETRFPAAALLSTNARTDLNCKQIYPPCFIKLTTKQTVFLKAGPSFTLKTSCVSFVVWVYSDFDCTCNRYKGCNFFVSIIITVKLIWASCRLFSLNPYNFLSVLADTKNREIDNHRSD